MRLKVATDTFVSRNKTALQGRTPREKSEASFGATMVTMYHKIARNAHCDPTALLKRKLDAFASQILFLEAAGHHEEVRKYKRLQLEASTEMCDELIKLSTVHVSTTSQSNTVIELLNSSTSSSSTYDNDSD